MKGIGALLLITLLLTLGACNRQDSADAQRDWLSDADLTAWESSEELYAAALGEGVLILYTDSTRTFDTKAVFERCYPGLAVEIHDIRSTDMIALLEERAGRDEPLCDLVVCSDTGGRMHTKLVPQGILHKYVPYDIEAMILPEHNGRLLEFVGEGVQLFYNSEVYAAPPIANWWELTEPRFRGKIWMGDPARSHSTFTLMCAMIRYSEEMEDAYYALYGEHLLIPAGSTAGQEYWRMLLENDIRFTSSSEEAMEQVGRPGQTDPPVAVMVSSKARKADIGYAIAPVYNLSPSTGVFTPNNIMIVQGAPNIHAAKLFVRCLLGESDGTGEGYHAYLQEGAWPVRSDVAGLASIPLENAGFWELDRDWYGENSGWIMEFWMEIRGKG